MYIPKVMNEQIVKFFYDKKIDVLEVKERISQDGAIKKEIGNVIDTFYGNVSYSNCKKVKEQYGLDYEINITITTDYNVLKLNDYIKYENIIYSITNIFKHDSHYMLVGVRI